MIPDDMRVLRNAADTAGLSHEFGVLTNELATLRAERVRARRNAEQWRSAYHDLRAELAEAQKDAERYRWLREKIENDDFVIARVSDWGLTSWSGDDPDRYIDAALAAKEE